MDFIRRNRKALIIGGLSLFTIVSLVAVGTGFMVYKSIVVTTEAVMKSSAQLKVPQSGFGGELAMEVAGGWLERQLNSPEVVSIKHGLACFDAVGGPSPQQMIAYLQRRVSDQGAQKKLADINAQFAKEGRTVSGPAACANWMLNG